MRWRDALTEKSLEIGEGICLTNLRSFAISESSMSSNMVLSFIYVNYRNLKLSKYVYSGCDDKTRHQQI
jgi:hypothetical protein